ncbi:MAG: response regulator [Anaerolineae bacterium]
MPDKLLVVDDEADLLRLVSYTMRTEGYLVIEAETGAEALQKIVTEKPDLIVLDVMLPDMSGLEVCKKLRMNADTAGTPVIMLSARVQVSDKIGGLEAGADDYVAKPFDMDELVARVRGLLNRTRRLGNIRASKMGKVLGFVGAKGGVGTTTVAINVAASLAQSKRDVIAVELSPLYGALRFYANRDKARSLDDLVDLEPSQITEQKLNECLVSTSSGMRLLLGSTDPLRVQALTPQQTEAIIRGLAHMADMIVVDFAAFQSDANRLAVQLCSFVSLIVTPDMACATLAIKSVKLMNSWGISGDSLGIVVVNRTPALTMSAIEIGRRLGCGVLAVVPNMAEALEKAVGVGIPLVISQPHNLASEACTSIAGRLAADRIIFTAF